MGWRKSKATVGTQDILLRLYSYCHISARCSIAEYATHHFYVDGASVEPKSDINILRRRMFSKFVLDVKAGQTVVLEKFSNVFTSRDKELAGCTKNELQAHALQQLQEDENTGFDALLAESAACWLDKVWMRVPIAIDGPGFDQLAIRFAQYHMQLMTPAHDNRMNIGAKGLSGEGYKGHTFWDTEIFLLPYFIFNMPEVARSLEEYRYLSLPGAHAKAAHNGYVGAQFPWESAWLDDGEVTPEYMGTDIVTGQLIKVWSGFIEIHITADVAYGVWQYYMCTGDQDFMDKYGYELMLDCAKFWASRLEPGEDGKLHINDVVGPDEYKEHVDDNAFTNYLVWWSIGKAIRVAAYCRTVVNSDGQFNGVAAQKSYYTQKISENPDWQMVGIFADAGITSADRKKRVELNRLIAACKRGEVDMIITKSVSRFARDIRDCVGLIQELKAVGVGVIFEKEDINTLGESNNIYLTILGTLARLESENITPNLIYPARQMDKFAII